MSFIVDFEPIGQRVTAEPGETILQVAQRGGIGIAAVCGGVGICRRCLVQVMAGQTSPPTEDEQIRVGSVQIEQGFRLSCIARIESDLKVNVPAASLTTMQRTQVEGRELHVPFDPVVKTYEVELTPAKQADLRSDAHRLCDALKSQGAGCVLVDLGAAQRLPTVLRAHDWKANAAVIEGRVVAVLPPGNPPLGIAVDLGSTKVAGYLVDLQNGETLSSFGMMNPQIAYGEDVMARLTYVVQNPDGAETLQKVIVNGLGELAEQLCALGGQKCQDIVEAVIVGNTAMHHLLLGLPTEQLGAAPYIAALSEACNLMGRDIGLSTLSGVWIHILPNIAGFVGADHVAMLLGTGIYDADDVVLGLDIGTNTEVALKVGNRLLCCSTASGPAFEGAHIQAGMRAGPGAIERVWLDSEHVSIQVIDDMPPVGLCGSGILDVVGQLRKIGLLNDLGGMSLDHERVRLTDSGPEFVLVTEAESSNGHEIVFARGDVSEIQLAKGAMRAGVEVLLQQAGITVADLDRIVIAGAFGTYIDIRNALRVGMFPRLGLDRFDQVGNAAGVGARLALISSEQRKLAQSIATRAEYVELTNDPQFTMAFTDAMFLPKIESV